MPTWLDSLDFLSPDQRATLAQHDLDTPAAVRSLSASAISEATGLTLGKVGKLLTAAAEAHAPAKPNPISVVVSAPVERSRDERIQATLAEAATDPTRLTALLDLGVDRVVVGTPQAPDSDVVNVEQTRAMLAHAATGAPVGATWGGLRIVDIAEVVSPRIYCNPRTSKALQGGADEISLVPWAQLGLDGLRLAAYGYMRGLFDGRPEEAVFASVRDDAALRQRITVMAKAAGDKLEDLDDRLIWRPAKGQPAAPARDTQRIRMRGGQSATSPWIALEELLLRRFSGDEMRRLFSNYLGSEFCSALPGTNASPATLAHDAVDLIRRRGLATPELQRALRAERPRAADEIDAVFVALGIA